MHWILPILFCRCIGTRRNPNGLQQCRDCFKLYVMKRMVLFAFSLLIALGNVALADDTGRVLSKPEMQNASMGQRELVLSIDLGNLDSRTETEISREISEFLEAGLGTVDGELICKVNVKGKVTVGVASVEITVEVSGPCAEVKAHGTEIANQVLNEVKKALQKAL